MCLYAQGGIKAKRQPFCGWCSREVMRSWTWSKRCVVVHILSDVGTDNTQQVTLSTLISCHVKKGTATPPQGGRGRQHHQATPVEERSNTPKEEKKKSSNTTHEVKATAQKKSIAESREVRRQSRTKNKKQGKPPLYITFLAVRHITFFTCKKEDGVENGTAAPTKEAPTTPKERENAAPLQRERRQTPPHNKNQEEKQHHRERVTIANVKNNDHAKAQRPK